MGLILLSALVRMKGVVRLSGVLKVSANKEPRISYDKVSQYLTTLTLNTGRRQWAV